MTEQEERRSKAAQAAKKDSSTQEEKTTEETIRIPKPTPTSKQMDPGEKISNSTPKKSQKKSAEKLKRIDSKTRPEDIQDTFRNHNLAPGDWETLSDQLLQRGV